MIRGRSLGMAEDASAASVRAALYAAIGIGALIDDRPDQYGPTFAAVLVLAFVFCALTVAFPPGRTRIPWAYAIVDLALLAVLAHASGGASSEVRFAFFAMPVLAALRYRPRTTVVLSLAVTATYASLSLNDGADRDQQLVAVEIVYLVWSAFAALVLSSALTRRARTIQELAEVRGRLMVEALDAEERERRRLAGRLHDGAVQNLLVVGQDLADAENGDSEALPRARAIVGDTIPLLRNLLVELHPGLLTTSSLSAALTAMADGQARRAGFEAEVTVDPAAEGVHDRVVSSLARELVLNAVKHAHAEHVTIAVRTERSGVVLEVSDDGRGFDPARRARAIADGHIGLASCAERAELLGGTFELETRPGAGATIRVWIP
jgi:two-component system, NarL family, sensor kinase